MEVILATAIPEETCRRINLGYLDPASIRLADYMDKEEEGILYVDHAGETLYRLAGEDICRVQLTICKFRLTNPYNDRIGHRMTSTA